MCDGNDDPSEGPYTEYKWAPKGCSDGVGEHKQTHRTHIWTGVCNAQWNRVGRPKVCVEKGAVFLCGFFFFDLNKTSHLRIGCDALWGLCVCTSAHVWDIVVIITNPS